MSDWHIRKIPKGTYGELSKITEELEEALDSEERGQILMLMFELSDIIGAAGGVAAKYGMKLDDLVTFSKLRSEIAIKDLELKKIEQASEKVSEIAQDFSRMPRWEDLQTEMNENIQAMLGNRDWCMKRFQRGKGHSCIVKWNKITNQPFDGKPIADFMRPNEWKYHTLHQPKDRKLPYEDDVPDGTDGSSEEYFASKCPEQLREEDLSKETTLAVVMESSWSTRWLTAFISWMKSFLFWNSHRTPNRSNSRRRNRSQSHRHLRWQAPGKRNRVR